MNLVEAGEQAGALETLLDKIASYKEKTEALKKKIKKALFYPTAVLVVAVIVTIILLIFVIPQFESLFKGFGADLPAFTQMVVNLSRFVQHQGWWMLIVTVGAIYAFLYFKKRSRPMRRNLDRMMLKFPIIGPIMVKAAIARFARTLSTMFAAGVPLVEAMQSVAGATGNIVYEEATLRMKDEVATGQRLQRAMENTGLFPNMVVQMIAVGEESGSLDQMSGKVAEFYEAEVDAAVDGMSSLLEPLIMADPRRARRRHGDRDVPADLQARFGRLRPARASMLHDLAAVYAGNPALFAGSAGLVGLVVGSFLNVVIYRLPLMLDREWRAQATDLLRAADSAQTARHHHRHRGTCRAVQPDRAALRRARTARRRSRRGTTCPVLSWLMLRGRCAACGEKIIRALPGGRTSARASPPPPSPGISASAPPPPARSSSPGP